MSFFAKRKIAFGPFPVVPLLEANDDNCPNCYPMGCDCDDTMRPPDDIADNDPNQCNKCGYYGEACPRHFE